jgi:hypothetical protein
MADPPRRGRLAAARLRLGIVLWLVSWMPIPIILGISGKGRYLIWGAQFVVGAIGLVLAGSAFFDAVKHLGWKRAPRALGRALVHGDGDSALSPET